MIICVNCSCHAISGVSITGMGMGCRAAGNSVIAMTECSKALHIPCRCNFVTRRVNIKDTTYPHHEQQLSACARLPACLRAVSVCLSVSIADANCRPLLARREMQKRGRIAAKLLMLSVRREWPQCPAVYVEQVERDNSDRCLPAMVAHRLTAYTRHGSIRGAEKHSYTRCILYATKLCFRI